jgi:hypothetical protein
MGFKIRDADTQQLIELDTTVVGDKHVLKVESESGGNGPTIGASTTNNIAVAVGGNECAAANPNRDSLVLSVPSTASDSVWFSLDNAPAIGKGIEVQPGGSLVLGKRAVLCWFGIVHAISAQAVTLGRMEVNSA